MKPNRNAALAAVLVAVASIPATTLPAAAEMAAKPPPRYEAYGVASWYGPGFQGSRTASGERFDSKALTAAHPTLPFGTLVEVSRLDKKKSVIVVVTDRGPFVAGRSIDLSRAAARKLSMSYQGAVPVSLRVVGRTE